MGFYTIWQRFLEKLGYEAVHGSHGGMGASSAAAGTLSKPKKKMDTSEKDGELKPEYYMGVPF